MPNDAGLLNEWGLLLTARAKRAGGEEAAHIRGEARMKYEAALVIAPDAEPPLSNLGNLMVEQAKSATGDERERLLADGVSTLQKLATLEPTATYDLACAFALQGNEEHCRSNLENAEKCATLPDIAHIASDPDLAAIHDKAWFQELLARQKAKASS
jgi:hypothetical protein